jgi:hypothetical protein
LDKVYFSLGRSIINDESSFYSAAVVRLSNKSCSLIKISKTSAARLASIISEQIRKGVENVPVVMTPGGHAIRDP